MAEHNPDDHEKPTNSTYTAWNFLFCNTGYHAEHHTFPAVPGCYLPRVSAAAPQYFRPCENTTSWPALWSRWGERGASSQAAQPLAQPAPSPVLTLTCTLSPRLAAANGFRSFRITPYQEQLAVGGRCALSRSKTD